MRADIEILRPWEPGTGPDLQALSRAIKKHPDSARLHFRLGTLGGEQQRSQALKRTSELDPDNAFPLYLLASRAASEGSWNQAADLFAQGHRRSRMDWFPLPYDTCKDDLFMESFVHTANSTARISLHSPLRQLARDVGKHAEELHAAGRTDEALAVIADVKQIAWKLMQSEEAIAMDVFMGVALIKASQKYETQMYTDIGSESGLARIEEDNGKLRYLRAGAHGYFDIMEERMRRIARRSAPLEPVASGFLQVWLTVAVLVLWAGFALRTRKKSASELHFNATSRAFPIGRLFKLYALIFLPLGIAAAVFTWFNFSSGFLGLGVMVGVVAVLPSIVLLWLSNRLYKKAYLHEGQVRGQENPRFWRGAPAQDKREVLRRLAGVYGGAVIFLALWALLVSGGMKLTMGAFPWQIERATAGMYQFERQYVADLLAGKIKVPEEKIRELEREEKRGQEESHRPDGGDKSGASRKVR